MRNPTPEQIVAGVSRSVESVLTVHQDGHAFADIEDIRSAITTGVALALCGLIVVSEQTDV